MLRKRHQNSYSSDHLQIATKTGQNPAQELASALLLYRPKSIVRMPLFSAVFQLFAQNLPKSKETKSLNMVGPSMRTGETLRYPSRQNRTVAGLSDRRQLESASFTPCEGACRVPGFPPSRRAASQGRHGIAPSSGACPPAPMRCRPDRCRPPRSRRRGRS